MFRQSKFWSKIKNKGNNNTYYVNSVIHQKDLHDEVQKLLQEGKMQDAADLLSRVIKGASAQHPVSPHWEYGISLNHSDGSVIVSHVPKSESALKSHPLKGSLQVKVPNEIKKNFKNWEEVIQYSYNNQQVFEFDATSFEASIGETIIEKRNGQMRVKITPQSFPSPLPMRLYTENGKSSFDYLKIGLSKIDDETLIMDNSTQVESEVLVILKANVKTKHITLDITLNKKRENKVKSELKFLKFVYEAKSNPFSLKILENDKDVFKAKNWNIDVKNIEDMKNAIKFLERLKRIEEFFNIEFELPQNITKKDEEAIYILEYIVDSEAVQGTFQQTSVELNSINDMKGIVEVLNDNAEGVILSVEMHNPFINLFGTTIPFAKSISTYNNLKAKDLKKLEGKLQYMEDGETVIVELVPGTSNQVEERFLLNDSLSN